MQLRLTQALLWVQVATFALDPVKLGFELQVLLSWVGLPPARNRVGVGQVMPGPLLPPLSLAALEEGTPLFE